MASSEWFSTFDLRASYQQVGVNPSDSDKTVFICPSGMFKFQKMPFGLCNSGTTFQRLMDVGLQFQICLVYIDDIILFSQTIDQHLERLVTVLDWLRSAGLKLKPEKCALFQKSVSCLDARLLQILRRSKLYRNGRFQNQVAKFVHLLVWLDITDDLCCSLQVLLDLFMPWSVKVEASLSLKKQKNRLISWNQR